MSPRVALVTSTTADEPGTLLAARLRHLVDAGWDARLFCKGERWARDPALQDPALRERVAHAPKARRDDSPFDRRLRRLAPDLVHFHSGWAAWKGMRRGQLEGRRIAISLRADSMDLAVPDLELLWRRADLILFPHATALERAVARGCPRDRAEVLHPPVWIAEAEAERAAHSGHLRILSAGSLVWEQGFEHSVHAIRLLLDRGVDCEYRIVGGGGDHVQAVAFARHQLGLAERVHLIAPDRDDLLMEELHGADVFVDPAVTDTTSPTPLAAAQAAGVPFVATARRAGLPEEAGLSVPRRDPMAIAEALARLAADPELRLRMGHAGQRILGIPTLEDHVVRLEGLYRGTLAPVA